MQCLGDHGEGECVGEVRLRPSLPARWETWGGEKMFARCDRHYDDYRARFEARERRDAEARRRNYCKHGTFIGDPYGPDYLCGKCEDGE